MKQFRNIMPLAAIALLGLTSCLKEHDVNVSTEDKSATFVGLQFLKEGGTTINSGLQYFAGAALIYSPDDDTVTESFNISVNGPDYLSKDLNVTLGIDQTKVLDNLAGDNITYDLMPDSVYDLSKTTVVVPGNVRAVPVDITFYPSKMDPTKSYMLPVTVSNADGMTISRNFGTIYFHVIGNILAGPYTASGTRYNYVGASGFAGTTFPTPTGTVNLAASKNASPNSPTVIQLDYANTASLGYAYVLTYDPANPTVIEVAQNKKFKDESSQFKVWVNTYDPATKTIHILTSYNNGADGSGNDRVVDETFTHD